jgi:hypothetical protein
VILDAEHRPNKLINDQRGISEWLSFVLFIFRRERNQIKTWFGVKVRDLKPKTDPKGGAADEKKDDKRAPGRKG